MNTWYIGVDEHGCFNPLNPDDDSYVCAVITQADSIQCKEVFEYVYEMVRSNHAKDDDQLLDFFHGMKHPNPVKELMLGSIWKKSPDLIKKIVISANRPYVVSNPQQWWIMALQSVLTSIFESKLFSVDDKVNIHIGTRALEVIGFYVPKDIVAAEENSNDYLKLHGDYHEFLGKEIKQWLKSHYPMVKNVECVSAKKSYLVTLADQASNMAFPCFRYMIPMGMLELAPCQSFLPDVNIDEQIRTGEYLEATKNFIDLYFAKRKEDSLVHLTSILEKKDEQLFNSAKFDIWQVIITACKTALENRGFDGTCIQRVGKAIDVLKNFTGDIPTTLVPRYNEMFSTYLAHSGAGDRIAFESMEGLLRDCSTFPNIYEQWKSFVDLQLSKSQVLFNSYDFDVPFMWKIYGAYGEILKSMQCTLGLKKNFVDDTYASIVGTIAQSEAFIGNHASAIKMFEEDYQHTSGKWESQIASFLVVECWHMGDWESCLKWFTLQVGKTFEDFGNTFDQNTDQWLVLNYLRIYALGVKLGKALPNFPIDKKRWTRTGDYPFVLIEKWVGVCNLLRAKINQGVVGVDCVRLQNDGLKCLRKAAECLANSNEMVLKSLALPLLKICYAFGNYDECDKYYREYTNLIEECKQTKSFAQFIEGKEQFILPDEPNKIDVWNSATMLPFNYS